MPFDFKQILAIALVLFTLATVFYAIIYSIGWILLRIYRWFYKQAWFATRVQKIQKVIHDWFYTETPQEKAIYKWFKKRKPEFEKLADFCSEILIDPIFYGYALIALVDRLQSINEYAKQYPQYGFWRILDIDMRTDFSFYMVFMILFTLWMFSKVWKHNQDVKDKRVMTKSLANIASILKKMNKKLDKLPGNDKKDSGKKGE